VSARARTRAVVSRESRRGSRATRESESKRGRTSDSFPARLVIRSGRRHFHTPSRRRNRRGAAPPRATPRVRLRNAERTRSPAKRGRLFPRAALTNVIPPPRSELFLGNESGKGDGAMQRTMLRSQVRPCLLEILNFGMKKSEIKSSSCRIFVPKRSPRCWILRNLNTRRWTFSAHFDGEATLRSGSVSELTRRQSR